LSAIVFKYKHVHTVVHHGDSFNASQWCMLAYEPDAFLFVMPGFYQRSLYLLAVSLFYWWTDTSSYICHTWWKCCPTVERPSTQSWWSFLFLASFVWTTKIHFSMINKNGIIIVIIIYWFWYILCYTSHLLPVKRLRKNVASIDFINCTIITKVKIFLILFYAFIQHYVDMKTFKFQC